MILKFLPIVFVLLGLFPQTLNTFSNPAENEKLVKQALSKAESALEIIEQPEKFRTLVLSQDYQTLAFVGQVMLRSKIYGPETDFFGLVESITGSVANKEELVRKLQIQVLPKVQFAAKMNNLDLKFDRDLEAFYLPEEWTIYIRAESVTDLLKYTVLILHETVHASLSRYLAKDSQTEEALTVILLGKMLKQEKSNAAFNLLYDQAIKDLLEKLETN